jgi:hypothetical protein
VPGLPYWYNNNIPHPVRVAPTIAPTLGWRNPTRRCYT